MEQYRLYNGIKIPSIGFGTYKATTESGEKVIADAIKAGYRHFDSAAFYDNEVEVGTAIAKSGIAREEFFITTKIWKEELGFDNVHRALEDSMEKLQIDYLDMYLIHWPRNSYTDETWRKILIDTWKAMEELYELGKIKVIGVSNCMPYHLEQLISNTKIVPMVNQIEYHPGYLQQSTVTYCRERNILLEAWSPIGRKRIFEEDVLIRMAEKYRVSIAQLCIRFSLQEGILPLPKSSNIERMKQNMDVFHFEISWEDMEIIKALPQIGWSGEHPDRVRVAI